MEVPAKQLTVSLMAAVVVVQTDVAAVLTFMRSAWGHQAGAVTELDVAQQRSLRRAERAQRVAESKEEKEKIVAEAEKLAQDYLKDPASVATAFKTCLVRRGSPSPPISLAMRSARNCCAIGAIR